jgi:hypothetical protein
LESRAIPRFKKKRIKYSTAKGLCGPHSGRT